MNTYTLTFCLNTEDVTLWLCAGQKWPEECDLANDSTSLQVHEYSTDIPY